MNYTESPTKGISVCLIVKNEEKNIYDCINSVKAIASEIIVNDTGSSDDTIRIAKDLGCNVFSSEWKDDFSYSRNLTLAQAKFKFILIIDADERLLNPEKLIEAVENAPNDCGGILVNLSSTINKDDLSKDIYDSSLLRVIKNQDNIRFENRIHEQVLPSILKNGLKVYQSDVQLAHIGYDLSENLMRSKYERNLRLIQKQLGEHQNDSYQLLHLAKTHLALGNYEKCEYYSQKAINNTDSKLLKPQILNFSAINAFKSGKSSLAKERALESLKLMPSQEFANFILSQVAEMEGDYSECFRYLRNIEDVKLSKSHEALLSGDYNLQNEDLQFKIGKSLFALKLYKEAAERFENVLAINPNYSTAMIGLANVKYLEFDLEAALQLLENAMALLPNDIDLKAKYDLVKSEFGAHSKHLDMLSQSNNRPIITLAMIVKNEEHTLEECLKSVQGVVDEIVIVDTGSDDNTKNLARKYTDKIYDFEWVGDFAKARNEALKRATGLWVLYMDADERLRPIDAQKLKEALIITEDRIGAFICTIESPYMSKQGVVENHRGGYPRLFKNLGYPKVKFIGRVHEQISPSLREAGLDFAKSDIIIYHTGYDTSLEIMDKKVRRNYELLIQHVKEEPLNSYAWFQLGQTLVRMDLHSEAENAIRFALNLGDLSPSVHASAANTLSHLCGSKKLYDEALKWADQSLTLAPNQLHGLNLKAHALLYIGKNKEALHFLEVLKSKMENFEEITPDSGFDVKPNLEMLEESILKAKKGIV